MYSLTDKKLNLISSQNFKLEREIQEVVEENLSILFNLELVKSEFRIKNFRIDSLGFDRENKSFVIVEYKKDKNFSVIDQGYTYLSLMLNNKSDFILEYNENCDDNLRRGDIDWSQSRVIFISPQFTDYQKNSVNFKDVPFELWEIKRYENGLVGFDQQKTTSEESISTTIIENKDSVVGSVTSEIKVQTEEDHLNQPKVQDSVRDVYNEFRKRILNLGDDIEIVPRKMYIGAKRKTNFVDINVGKTGLWCWINMKKGELDDPKNYCRDVSNIGHYGNGDYDFSVNETTDMDYVMFLVKQSYNKQGE